MRVRRRKPRWGVRRTHGQLGRRGLLVNRKRIERIWREHGLAVPKRKRKVRSLSEHEFWSLAHARVLLDRFRTQYKQNICTALSAT